MLQTDVGTQSKIKVLSLHGGGYLGLATAAFIAEAERHFSTTAHESFDLFCGTSTGAILALGLAAGRTGKELTNLYRELGRQVFPKKMFPKVRGFLRCRYETKALRAFLEREFGDQTLGDLRTNGKFVLVPAFCLSNGKPRIFKTDHNEKLDSHDGYRLVEVALASAAAPTYFPIFTVQNPTNGTTEAFCDGGIFANDPSTLGYAEAVHDLSCKPEDVSLLSISTPRAFLGSWGAPSKLALGAIGWATRLPSLFIDGAAESSHQTLERIAGTASRYVRFALANESADGVAVNGLDDASPMATDALVQIGSETARLQDARDQLEPFFR